MTPVKLGEGPGQQSELTPSQAPKDRGRCREQTAGTYGGKTRVKACSRLRTPDRAAAAKAEVGRKSVALTGMSVRLRSRAPSLQTITILAPLADPTEKQPHLPRSALLGSLFAIARPELQRLFDISGCFGPIDAHPARNLGPVVLLSNAQLVRLAAFGRQAF
jgi:hypothetical protein